MRAIYKITSPANKVYIGKTLNVKSRFAAYKYLHCKKQRLLYHSLLKYGFEAHSFEIVKEIKSDVELKLIDAFEESIYNDYVAAGFVMLNLQVPGRSINGFNKHSEETRKLFSISRKGNTNRLGKKNKLPLSLYTRSKMSMSHQGKEFTDSHKNNIRRSNPKRKGVLQYSLEGTLVNEFSSINEASKHLGRNKSFVQRIISGQRKNTTQFIFKIR